MRKRASILLAVMVVITVGALIGATVMYRFDAWRGGAAVNLERDRLRALAWSGVQGAMAEIEAQRDLMLEGGAPTITTEWELWDEGGARGIVRVTLVQAEGGKLDINHAEHTMLCGIGAVGEGLAAKIVAARAAGEFDSVESMATLDGVTPSDLFGGEEAESAASLLSLLTAFSFDPDAQATLGDGAASGRGDKRVHVSGGWSEEVKRSLAPRMSAAGLAAAEIALRGEPASTDADIVKRLREGGVAPAAWGEVLDVITTGDDAYRRGRVDLSNAPATVLACVPGIGAESATRLVESRAALDARARSSVAWPVTAGILTPEAFETAAPWLTTRSLVWRVRVEAVIEAGESDSPSVRGRMVWDAVIDACNSTARVAYLRDATYQGLVKPPAPANDEESTVSPSAEAAGDEIGPEIVEEPPPAPEPEISAELPSMVTPPTGSGEQSDRRLGRWRGRPR